MKRRNVIRGIVAASVTAVVPAGAAAAERTAAAGDISADTEDCLSKWHSKCNFVEFKCYEIDCPDECCECLCYS